MLNKDDIKFIHREKTIELMQDPDIAIENYIEQFEMEKMKEQERIEEAKRKDIEERENSLVYIVLQKLYLKNFYFLKKEKLVILFLYILKYSN